MKIPSQLQNTEFRFFLIRENSKIPMEKSWNDKNCYPFFHHKIVSHEGNYGVCTGPGNLIVIDFDNIDFYNEVADKLQPTFTILSASKRLPHMYYLLNGLMFKKIAIRDKEDSVMCDIQADRCGIVGPGSKINRRYYQINNDRKIAQISLKQLSEAFGDRFRPRQRKEYTGPVVESPAHVDKIINALVKLGIKRTSYNSFQCPFHNMSGKGNLHVLTTGRIYCFHEQKTWHSIEEFVIAFELAKQPKQLLKKQNVFSTDLTKRGKKNGS